MLIVEVLIMIIIFDDYCPVFPSLVSTTDFLLMKINRDRSKGDNYTQ